MSKDKQDSAIRVWEGNLLGEGLKVAIVSSRFNHFITDQLVEGALDALSRHGVKKENVHIARVPGSFEIPIAVKRLARSNRYGAVIALGALIRGGTPHFEYLAAEVTKGLAQVALETDVPVAYGIITADTLEQAIERAGTKAGNKGFEAALSAIEMANLLAQI